jgi:hypothetical protein
MSCSLPTSPVSGGSSRSRRRYRRAELALKVNHAMMSALLKRATRVIIRAEGEARPLVRAIKLRGLLCNARPDAQGRHIRLDIGAEARPTRDRTRGCVGRARAAPRVPDADVAIIVGGALGEREHVQRIGRLLRPRPGKRAVVYELVTAGTSETRLATKRRRGLRASVTCFPAV